MRASKLLSWLQVLDNVARSTLSRFHGPAGLVFATSQKDESLYSNCFFTLLDAIEMGIVWVSSMVKHSAIALLRSGHSAPKGIAYR